MILGTCRSFWVVSSGFQWLTVLVATVKLVPLNLKEVNNYGEFSNISQQDAMTKFLRNSAYKVSLKRPWVDERIFVLWKLTYIALSKFILFWLCFFPFWDNFFKVFFQGFGLLLVGRSVFWAYYLPNVLISWNLVLIIFTKFQWYISRKVMEGNGKLKNSKWKPLCKNKKSQIWTKRSPFWIFQTEIWQSYNVIFEINALEFIQIPKNEQNNNDKSNK